MIVGFPRQDNIAHKHAYRKLLHPSTIINGPTLWGMVSIQLRLIPCSDGGWWGVTLIDALFKSSFLNAQPMCL